MLMRSLGRIPTFVLKPIQLLDGPVHYFLDIAEFAPDMVAEDCGNTTKA